MSSRTRFDLYERCRTAVRTLSIDHDLALALTDLDLVAPFAYRAFCSMQDARPGLPGAQAYDAPSVSGGSSNGSHPERMAEQDDRTEADRRLLDHTLSHLWFLVRPGVIMDPDQAVKNITADALVLRRLIEAWTPRPPTDKQRRDLTVANAAPVDCEHHATAGIFEPMHAHGTVGGNLDLPMRLCLACHNQVRRNGKLPSGEWMERRRRSGKDEKERV